MLKNCFTETTTVITATCVTMAPSSTTANTAVTNATAGVSGSGANMPPYYALAYIMKT